MRPQLSDVHPELQAGAAKAPLLTFNAWTVKAMRLALRFYRPPKTPDDISISNVFIPTADGQTKIRLRIYQPKLKPTNAPLLLWLHGGGFVIGRPEIDEATCIQIVRELGIVIVSVEYRAAPENSFPIPLDDAYSALKWAVAQSKSLGIDPSRIAIGGQSAGAGLAAGLVQLACDQGKIKPLFQSLVYPMLDDQTIHRADVARGYFAWNPNSNRYGWKSYLGKSSDAMDLPPYAVPARRDDLSRLPPAWIGVGTLDLFHDEDVAYAQRLRDCGVECELVIVPGGFHGFDVMSPETQVVKDFRKSQIAALRRYLFTV